MEYAADKNLDMKKFKAYIEGLTPEQLDWHGIVEHITSTWKTWSVQ